MGADVTEPPPEELTPEAILLLGRPLWQEAGLSGWLAWKFLVSRGLGCPLQGPNCIPLDHSLPILQDTPLYLSCGENPGCCGQ